MGQPSHCLLFLVCFMALTASSFGQTGAMSAAKSCAELRQEKLMFLMKQTQGDFPMFFRDTLQRVVEFMLPSECTKAKVTEVTSTFNPASNLEMGGPLSMAGDKGGVIYTRGSNNRLKRDAGDEEEDAVDRDLSREKRFLNGMGFGGPSPYTFEGLSSSFGGSPSMMGGGPKKEVSESTQMLNNMLFFTRLQSAMARRTYTPYGPSNPGGYSGNYATSIGNGMYGDSFFGGKRKKRSADKASAHEGASSLSGESTDTVKSPLSRKRRFFLPEGMGMEMGMGMGMMDPTQEGMSMVNPVQQFMSIMMGTARDPKTGKKMDFGGDGMKRMMRNSYLSTLPPHMRPPPGKEPSEMVKAMAPIWYFRRIQSAMQPRPAMPAYRMEDPRMYSQRSLPRTKNRDGYFGDVVPGRTGRRRRSTSGLSDDRNDDVMMHSISKRQAEGGNNDVITIGDVSIPMDFFKPREYNEDYYKKQAKYNSNRGYSTPRNSYYGDYYQPRANNYYNSRQQQQQQMYHQELLRQQQELKRQRWLLYQQQQQFKQQQQQQQQPQQFYQQQSTQQNQNAVYPPSQQQYRSNQNQAPPANQQYAPPLNQYNPPPQQPQSHTPFSPAPKQPPFPRTQAPSYPSNRRLPQAQNMANPASQPTSQMFSPPANTASQPMTNNFYNYKPAYHSPPPPPQQMDPFIYSSHGRVKRNSGDDKNKISDDLYKSFLPPVFPGGLYSPYSPSYTSASSYFMPRRQLPFFAHPYANSLFGNPYTSSYTKKLAYTPTGATGGVVYGDRLPWTSSAIGRSQSAPNSQPIPATLPPVNQPITG